MAESILHKVKSFIWPFSHDEKVDIDRLADSNPTADETSSRESRGAINDRSAPERKNPATTGTHGSASSQDKLDATLRLDEQFYQAVFDLVEPVALSNKRQALSVPETLVLQVVEDSLRSPEHRLKSVPRLPTVVPQLLKSLRDPKSSADNYVKIIKQDPAIASAVLKIANSVYFNPNQQLIDSFQRAVVTLGTQGLRTLLSTAVMQPIIHCKSPYYMTFGKRLWDHSLCCAVTSQTIAERTGLDPFKAYLAGLIHDVGKITIFTQLAQQFKLNVSKDTPPALAFITLMNSLSCELSYWIAKDWGFPEETLIALRDQIDGDENSMSSLGRCLYTANLATECYAAERAKIIPSAQAKQLLEKYSLPKSLFRELDSLFMLVEKQDKQ